MWTGFRVVMAFVTKNPPVGLILLGLFVAVLGAAGSVPSIGLKFESPWQGVTVLLGVVVVAAGGVWLFLVPITTEPVADFEITSAPEVYLHGAEGHRNRNFYDLYGRYRRKPPDGCSVGIIEIGTGGGYRLRRKVYLSDEKKWEAKDIYAIKEGPIRVAVAHVGASGEALWQYYDKVRHRHGLNSTPAVDKLPDDIKIFHSVSVNARRVP